MPTLTEIQRRALTDPESFWADAAGGVEFTRSWDRVLDDSRAPLFAWFRGARLNTCFNALDRHADGDRATRTALIHDSAMTGEVTKFTFAELRERVAAFAGVLTRLGVTRGDRVVIYMPMVPETAIAMLACARLGAIHSVVFGGFASKELASRLDDAGPKVVVSASCGLEPSRVVPYKPLLDGAIELAEHTPQHCVILQRPMAHAELIPGRDVDWNEAMAAATPHECVDVAATDPLYILYTSGTTGTPKGIVRDNGGHAVALHWSMKNVYGVNPGDVFWAASDVGWVVGHSYIVYGPLLNGNTTVMFEGKPVGTPDAGAFWRVVERHGVDAMFTAPTAFRAIKQHDFGGEFIRDRDLSSLRALFLAGERCDPDTLAWARRHLEIPVIDHWWQTESGWPIASNCLGIESLQIKPGSAARAVPGWDVRVLDPESQLEMPPGEMGEIVCKLPLPPGSLPSLWKADERYVERYLTRFPGYYETDDAGYLDEDGYLFVMARTDDIINVAGHRLSTGAIEEVIDGHPDVAECAVFGVADELKGQVPVGLLTLEAGIDRRPEDVVAEVVAAVRADIGPVAVFKHAAVVTRLPKTRSGKILRQTMRKIADGEAYTIPPTIEDPAVLDEIGSALATIRAS